MALKTLSKAALFALKTGLASPPGAQQDATWGLTPAVARKLCRDGLLNVAIGFERMSQREMVVSYRLTNEGRDLAAALAFVEAVSSLAVAS